MGSRIGQARARAGQSQAELATQASMDRSALAKVENGSRRVSALELARLAEALGERIEWFVAEPPPAIVSRRNLAEPGTASPSIDRAVERIAQHVEFVQKHDQAFGFTAPMINRPTNAEQAEQAASHARGLLDVDGHLPLHGISDHAAKLGLLVFSLDLGPDAADASSIMLERGSVAVINGNLHVGRRRLAAAHELGHCLFADEYTVDWKVDTRNNDPWEARLDRFARALLLPRSGLQHAWEQCRQEGNSLRTIAIKIASHFRVDMTTLAQRTRETDLLGEHDAAHVRTIRTTRADIVELDLVTSDELAAPALARAYELSILRLYRAETISAARAVELLLDSWDESELPELSNLPESAIWQFVS